MNVKVMKRWKAVTLDDEMKRTMSRDSENARSHPIKPVTTSACACQELDAIDDLFERSLYCTGISRDFLYHRAVPCDLLHNCTPNPTLKGSFEVSDPNCG